MSELQSSHLQRLAIGAGLIAILATIATGRLPRGLRIALVIAVGGLCFGAGLYAYRYYSRPTILTVAVGSVDGEAAKVMTAIAARIATSGAPVHLRVVDKGSALEAAKALSDGQADLAIARADLPNLSDARAVVTFTYAVVLVVVPPGSSITSMDELAGKSVGVIGGDINRQVVAALTKEYDLDRAKVRFKDVAVADLPQAVKSKQVQAILAVVPISEKYLSLLRDGFPRNSKLKIGLLPIESADAIAAFAKAYESYELPKGTLRGSPPLPDDDLTTLRVPLHLVANAKLKDDVVTALTKAIMETRRELLGEFPILAQISAPDTDKDAFIPVHPGAAAYFDGDEKTFFDKYGDQIFYGSMLLGSLMSVFAGVWKFVAKDADRGTARPLDRLHAMREEMAEAMDENEIAGIERRVDDILKSATNRQGEAEAAEIAALEVAAMRLDHLATQRRLALGNRVGPARVRM